MNSEIKAEWIKRLRSGNYKQGAGYLQRDGEFCCLGILCEIAVEKGISFKSLELGTTLYDGKAGMPTYEIIKDWADFSYQDAENLAEENDNGTSFEGIADMIERDF